MRGIHHLTLRVRDLDRARAFYRDVLGLQADQDFAGQKLRFRIPGTDTRLVLHPPLDGTPVDDRFDERRIGLDHLALHIGSEDELDELVGRLRAAGVVHDLKTDQQGPAVVSFRDPDNVQWELFKQ